MVPFHESWGQDTLWTWTSPSAAEVSVSVRGSVGVSSGAYLYNYLLISDNSSEQDIESFFVDHISSIISLGSPNEWLGDLSATRDAVMWGAGSSLARIEPGQQLAGFAISSGGLPGIFPFYIRGYRYIPPFEFGMTPDSIIGGDVFENSFKGRTVAPLNPPDPFNGLGFLDTIKSYINESRTLGWIASQDVANNYLGLFTRAKNDLGQEDTVMAVVRLDSVLRQIPIDSVNQLSSESYALLKFNTEYILSRLPIKVWQGTITSDTTWSGTLYVVGDVDVTSGATLTVMPGTNVKFFSGVRLEIDGNLTAVGNGNQHIEFLPYDPNQNWNSIVIQSGATATLEYADVSRSDIGILVKDDANFTMSHCIVDHTNIGLEIVPGDGEPVDTMSVTDNTFSNIISTGIFVDSYSHLLLQRNGLTGVSGGGVKWGIILNGSSPTLLGNTIGGFNYGLFCEAASSPQAVGIFGSYNACNSIASNDSGVWCQDQSNAVLGNFGDKEDYSSGEIIGYNSIYNNGVDAILQGECTVLAGTDYWGSSQMPSNFIILDESVLYYYAWLSEPPDCEETMITSGKTGGKVASILDPSIELMRGALITRLAGRYDEATNLLKVIVASTTIPLKIRKWAVTQLLAVSQRMRHPNLPAYLTTAIRDHPNLIRELRAVLPYSYLHEGMFTEAVAAFDANIRQYPNMWLERAALYGKFLVAVYRAKDMQLARTLYNALQTRYPRSADTHLAEMQLHFEETGRNRLGR